MYESPIHVFHKQLQAQLEGEILTAVQQVHADVNRDELIRALKYDRDQYDKGFRDGTPKWIPVSEGLPECENPVLAIDRDGLMSPAYYSGEWHSMLDGNAITHWMPLPDPPEGGDGCEPCGKTETGNH